eukprot:2574317-Amphidinium_carterae.2
MEQNGPLGSLQLAALFLTQEDKSVGNAPELCPRSLGEKHDEARHEHEVKQRLPLNPWPSFDI